MPQYGNLVTMRLYGGMVNDEMMKEIIAQS